MIIPLPSSLEVNMRFITKAFVLSSSILLLLSSTGFSTYTDHKNENHIKSATFVSEKFELGPGSIAVKAFWNIEFPRGHIGVKSFDAELIDEQGNPVPLYETYLHHYFTIRYFENITLSRNPKARQGQDPFEGMIFKRNEGTCREYILPHYWGLGADARGTPSNIPDPFAIELGNRKEILDGYEEKWLFNIMAIDTRGVQDREGCTECRCDLMNLPKEFYNVTKGINGKPLSPDYKGGVFCCHDNLQCKLREGFQGPRRKLALRYKIRWVDWDKYQMPVKFYVLDSTDRVRSNGSQTIHDCQVEYTIPTNNNNDSSLHVQKAKIPMKSGGYLIYGSAHVHSGVVNLTLYGEDGRTLCTTTPKYGTGNEAGNEKGYAVGMSVCYPKPGSVKIKKGEIVTVESIYKRGFRTGVMGHFYIYLAQMYRPQHIRHNFFDVQYNDLD